MNDRTDLPAALARALALPSRQVIEAAAHEHAVEYARNVEDQDVIVPSEIGFEDGVPWLHEKLAPLHSALVECVGALERIADPRLRGHSEPDAYTQHGCAINIADEVLARLTSLIEHGEGK